MQTWHRFLNEHGLELSIRRIPGKPYQALLIGAVDARDSGVLIAEGTTAADAEMGLILLLQGTILRAVPRPTDGQVMWEVPFPLSFAVPYILAGA